MPMFTQEETVAYNRGLVDRLDSGDTQLVKAAADSLNDYTRMILREEGFMRKVMPPKTITASDLDKTLTDNEGYKIVNREPFSPGAVTVPLNQLPKNFYLKTSKYPVYLTRITTPRATLDVDTLTAADIDVRQIVSDNMIKDIMLEEDTKFVSAINTALGGAAGTVLATTGVSQWQEIDGGIDRESLPDMIKVMRNTRAAISPTRAVVNQITVLDIIKWGRDEIGGDLAQELLQNGYSEQKLLGLEWHVTIKKALVPTNSIYLFAPPEWFGKHFMIQDTTMGLDRKYFFLEFFAYQRSGAAIGNCAGVSRVDFTG